MAIPTLEGDVEFRSRHGAWACSNPREIVTAMCPEDVVPAMRRVEEAVSRGRYAAGFLTYEAAPGFDPKLAVHQPSELPLLWFGLYDKTETPQDIPFGEHAADPWEALVSEPDYRTAIERIREYIAAGDTYQVNYTFPMRTAFDGDPRGWFHALYQSQPTGHAGYVDAGRFKILSLSPELFFEREGDTLTTRPMKGTRPRGRWPQEDDALLHALGESGKDRAENVMIVDLLRNDMGRVSQAGSVEVTSLFDVERYATVWQMTSTIRAKTTASTTEILAALFPSGSVTGAPKIRTMEIIRELESHPRGVYCGAIGWMAPGNRASFNVAIRTILVDTAQGHARYHVGGGITWDSSAEGEYEECRVKAEFLNRPRPAFSLLESILYDNGYFLLEEHLARLAGSAAYFEYPVDIDGLRANLLDTARAWTEGPLKVRVLVGRDGSCRIEAAPAPSPATVRLGFASHPVDDRDVFLFHKTTHREVYESARESRPDCDDVILWNSRGEVTETTTANIVVERDGRFLTPPVASGLLAGTMRAHLLATGEIEEAVLHKPDIVQAKAIYVINSVRKWVNASLITE